MLRTMTEQSRRQRWEDKANWPLTFTAVLFLAAYAWPILQPDLVNPWLTVCRLVTWAAWALFVVDCVARLALSSDPGSSAATRSISPSLPCPCCVLFGCCVW